MCDSAHLLEASITSALALKPSTVYVVRVENRASRAKWQLRKCFSEFSELREKVVGLIESTAGTTAVATKNSSYTNSSSSTCSIGSPAPSLSLSSTCSSAFDTGGSHTSRSSSGSSDATLMLESSASFSERFPYLFKQFPRRQLFGSRSKKVIERRTRALNAFVHQLLLYAREVRQQNQIAVYFSLRGFVEAFFECAEHSTSFVSATASNGFPFLGLKSPSTLAQTQAAAVAAARAAAVVSVGGPRTQRQPVHVPLSFNHDSESEKDDNEDDHRDITLAPGSNFHFTRRFYQEYGKSAVSNDSDDDDDEENRLVGLQKASSAITHRELREMKTHFTGSHYAPLQATGGASASGTWAARVEIAGIPSTASRTQQQLSQPPLSSRTHKQKVSSDSQMTRADLDEAPQWLADKSAPLFSKDPQNSRHTSSRRADRPAWA